MFCPKCSQQQVSDEARFCSRCGFQLGVVKAALAADDASDARAAVANFTAAPPADRSLRKRDLSIGAAIMFFVAFMVAAATVELPPGHSGPILGLVVTWLLLTVLINIRPLLRYFFGDLFRRPTTHDDEPQRFAPDLTTKVNAPARNAALPPATAGEPVPASLFGRRRANTAEVAPPPSVTDHTTNLLG